MIIMINNFVLKNKTNSFSFFFIFLFRISLYSIILLKDRLEANMSIKIEIEMIETYLSYK